MPLDNNSVLHIDGANLLNLEQAYLDLPHGACLTITGYESWLGRKKEDRDAYFSYFMTRHAFSFKTVRCDSAVITLEKL